MIQYGEDFVDMVGWRENNIVVMIKSSRLIVGSGDVAIKTGGGVELHRL